MHSTSRTAWCRVHTLPSPFQLTPTQPYPKQYSVCQQYIRASNLILICPLGVSVPTGHSLSTQWHMCPLTEACPLEWNQPQMSSEPSTSLDISLVLGPCYDSWIPEAKFSDSQIKHSQISLASAVVHLFQTVFEILSTESSTWQYSNFEFVNNVSFITEFINNFNRLFFIPISNILERVQTRPFGSIQTLWNALCLKWNGLESRLQVSALYFQVARVWFLPYFRDVP